MFFKPKNSARDDQELIKDFKETGDLKTLSELFSRYMHLVFGVCLNYLKDREESKDAVMQIFEKLSTEILNHDVANFKSWLHVMTKNYCLMKLRSDKSKMIREEKLKKDISIFMETSYVMHHDNGKAIDSDIEALRNCIEKLKAAQKQCVSLFYIDEKCYKEISEIVDIEIKKVKSHIQNGKRNLKICLEKNNVKG